MSTTEQVADAETLKYWHDIGRDPMPAPELLDAEQLVSLDADPLHERKWGFSR